jgi:sugar (pentulose or hexulose) kinase
MRQALIGIDVGATSIRVGAFDETAGLRALAVRPNARLPQDSARGWFVWDPARAYNELFALLEEVVA